MGILGDVAIGIHPAGCPLLFKRWQPTEYAGLCDQLVNRFDIKIILFGTNNDLDWAKVVVRNT